MKRLVALPLLFAFAAAFALRAQAQDEGAAQAPALPAAGDSAEAPEAPLPLPAPAPKAGAAAAPVAQAEEKEPPPPSSEPQAAPPAEVAPPIAQPETAASAMTSSSPPAEVEEEPESTVPFIASLSWSQAYNAAGLVRSAYQTFNPQYAWTFNGKLGYRFDERTSVALSQALAIELTDSDTTNTRQEPWLLDTAIDGQRELVEYELDAEHTLGANGTLGVLLPTSPPSQASTMLFAGKVALGGRYSADDVLHGLGAGVKFSYMHRFLRSNVPEVDQSYPCYQADLRDESQNCTHLGSSTNTRDLFVLGANADLGLTDELTLGVNVSFGWNRSAGLRDEEIPIASGTVLPFGDDSLTRWRNSRVIGFSLEYAFTDWFSAATLLTNSFAERSADNGRYRAPFNGQDMVLGLELSVSFDQLYEGTHGRAGDR
jgi:hypothetical protein